MQLNSAKPSSQQARGAAAILLSIVFVAAGGALAKNHDAQRIQRQATHVGNHDRASGPLEASNEFDHTAE